EALDRQRCLAMILTDNLVPFLGIEPNRNFGGTNQVTEQDREMTPLAYRAAAFYPKFPRNRAARRSASGIRRWGGTQLDPTFDAEFCTERTIMAAVGTTAVQGDAALETESGVRSIVVIAGGAAHGCSWLSMLTLLSLNRSICNLHACEHAASQRLFPQQES